MFIGVKLQALTGDLNETIGVHVDFLWKFKFARKPVAELHVFIGVSRPQ